LIKRWRRVFSHFAHLLIGDFLAARLEHLFLFGFFNAGICRRADFCVQIGHRSQHIEQYEICGCIAGVAMFWSSLQIYLHSFF
jgi:hypothetical protein